MSGLLANISQGLHAPTRHTIFNEMERMSLPHGQGPQCSPFPFLEEDWARLLHDDVPISTASYKELKPTCATFGESDLNVGLPFTQGTVERRDLIGSFDGILANPLMLSTFGEVENR